MSHSEGSERIAMNSPKVLLVGGTHGNEINAPWVLDNWTYKPSLQDQSTVRLVKVLGNPAAYKAGKRYLDRDLNRSFRKDLLSDYSSKDYEVGRARELLRGFGEGGLNPCKLVLDLHSTTSSMGSCLVVYGRRPCDLALAALIQFRLGVNIYLHEGDFSQQGFLVESWPCGLVVEVGPVPQNLLEISIVRKTSLILEAALEEISKVLVEKDIYPKSIVVHRHLGSLDLPRDDEGRPIACLHPELQNQDWSPIKRGTPMFLYPNGEVDRFDEKGYVVPVFINEAAYAEKRISMSLTKREVWPFEKQWKEDFRSFVRSQ